MYNKYASIGDIYVSNGLNTDSIKRNTYCAMMGFKPTLLIKE